MNQVLQFGRVAHLAIGPAGSEEGIAFRDFRIVFEVEKTDSNDSNKAKISIFNLSEATRNKIKKDDVVLLYAGYEQGSGEELVFAGNITRVSQAKRESDFETKIEAADGIKFMREIRIALSYKAGTVAKNILMDIVNLYKKNGVAVKWITPDIDTDQYVSGFAFEGLAKNCMDRICFRLDLEWGIHNNALKVTNRGKSDAGRAVYLDSSCGLLGVPERDDDAKDKAKASASKNGWKFKSLLRPQIEPKGLIQVSSVEVGKNKNFMVQTVTHRGDTQGDDWTSDIKAVLHD